MSKEDEIIKGLDNLHDWLIKIRRDFHENPELGMEEYRTSEKIAKYLEDMGIEYTRGIANTGVVGIIKGKHDGKTVALRADMDALPINDKKDVPYKSKVAGKMHACGHDAHMAILLGAAKILNDMKDNLTGNIKLFFQPAEETVGGAEQMIEEGVMENPRVDVVLGLHVAPDLDVGQIGIKYSKMNASSDTLKINIFGESSHGAYPHTGIDAIVIAGHVITALQSIVSRNIDPRNSAVISLGVIKGGTLGNIIANNVELIGTIRTLDPKVREQVINRIFKIVKSTCETFGGSSEVTIKEGYVALINHDEIVDSVKSNGEKILGKECVKTLDMPSMGVEDFAYFLRKAPGAYFRVGCRNEEKGIIHEGHHCLFDIDERCLTIGVKMQVENVLSILRRDNNEDYRY